MTELKKIIEENEWERYVKEKLEKFERLFNKYIREKSVINNDNINLVTSWEEELYAKELARGKTELLVKLMNIRILAELYEETNNIPMIL